MADAENPREPAEDFEAFWNQQERRGIRLNNVFGVDVELPPELPLRFEIEAQQLRNDRSKGGTRRMVAMLFGEHALDTWIEAGIDAEQLGVLLLWGSENADGNPMTLTEARTEYHRRRAALGSGGQGKAEAAEETNGD